MLQIEAFKKFYGPKLVISSSHYHFKEGIHWVKGQNGSGKTTFFKSLAGLVPFEGKIALNDISLKEDPIRYRLKVNYAEAEPLYPSVIRGEELMSLFKKHKKAPSGQVEHIVERLGINYLHEPTGTYSSGMGKKLSLLLAFLGEPQLILLDEPLVTLDTASVEAIFQLIHLYRKKYNTSFLISSHQAFEDDSLTPDHTHLIEKQTIQGIA